VTLTGVNVPLSQILLVSDATTGNVLYSMAGPASASYTQAANSVITLAIAPGSTDKLTIYYDDGVAPANAPTSVSVSNLPSTQPVSATSLPLPSGAATSALQTTGNSSLSSIDGKTPVLNADGGSPVHVQNFPSTQPISAAALPLPSGAAQDGTDGTGITVPTGGSGIRGWLSGIYSKLSAALAVTQSGTWSVGRTWNLASGTDAVSVQGGNSTAVKVDGSAVTQPVSLASVPSHPVTNAGTFAVQPSAGDLTSGSQTTKIVNGTNTLAVDSSGAITANNAANQTYTYTTTSSVTNGTVVIGPLNCSSYRTLILQITSYSSGSYNVQISNDNSTWTQIAGQQTTQYGSGMYWSTAGYGAGTSFFYPTYGANYIKVVVNTTLSGSTNALCCALSQQPLTITSVSPFNGPNALSVAAVPTASVINGFSSYHSLVCAATTNATLVKNSQGQIGSLILTNNSASWAYFKLCNTSTAPTPGTTTAVINIGVAPNSTLDCSTSFAGLRLSTGISYYVSAGTSLTDNTSLPAAGTFLVNMTYA